MKDFWRCWQEARRADRVAENLISIRAALDLEYYDHITAVLREVETVGLVLGDLYDLFPMYRSRGPMVADYLSIVLPSLLKTMRDMIVYIENDALSPTQQWLCMSETLAEQAGMALADRFIMYVEALVQMIRLLSRSPFYDPIKLERLRKNHLRLLAVQDIPGPPIPAKKNRALIKSSEVDLEVVIHSRRHWSEKLFEGLPHPMTSLRHKKDSQCFGPPMPEVGLAITPGSKVLFKLPFNKNRMSVTLYLDPQGPDCARLLCRWMDEYHNPLYSCYGVHELCVRRKGSALQFRRWSVDKMHPTVWICLFFNTWERMVLFHCAFGALKSRCPLTMNVWPDDTILMGERKLFQGKIRDDGFEHILSVLQDESCGGLRLHAAVRNGGLRRCPVWTAFITQKSFSQHGERDWLIRKSRYRIWLRDIRPYVFCQDYKKKNQIQPDGEFELYFVNDTAADAFQDIFSSEASDTDEPRSVPAILPDDGSNGQMQEVGRLSNIPRVFEPCS